MAQTVVTQGAGAPSHTAKIGTLYWDTTNDDLYINSSGSTTWQLVGGGSSGGGLNVSQFAFTHTTGSSSTGALGFTPAFCIYVGAIDDSGFFASMGFATGTGALARGMLAGDSASGSAAVVAADANAIAGSRATGTGYQTSFSDDLDVTVFGSGGITLAWSGTVTAQQGFLIVVG